MHVNVTPDTVGPGWMEILRKCTIKDKRDAFDGRVSELVPRLWKGEQTESQRRTASINRANIVTETRQY